MCAAVPESGEPLTFIPDFPTIAQFAIATFIIAITPGPDMTLFVGRALSEGRYAGLACMAGAMSGIVIHTSLVALGLSALIVASPGAFLVLKAVGAGYLVWLAFNAVRHGSAFKPERVAGAPSRSLLRNWATGLGINLLNPKIILFFMTFLPQFVSADDPAASGKLFVLGGEFALIYLPCCLLLVLAADRIALLLRTSRWVARALNYGFAAVFAGFAGLILTAQARH
jgi:threonine/homoserine/homoserine lactone efflux protein